MDKKIDKFLNSNGRMKKVAQEIVEAFIKEANKDNIEYSFDIAKGTGRVKNKQPNTIFSFDTKSGTLLEELKKALFNEDLAEIKQGSEEDKKLMNKVTKFLEKMAEEINFNYIEELQDTIRKVVLPTSKEEDIPLNEITINSIDISDFSSIPEPSKYTLKIGKLPDTNIDTAEITKYVHERQERNNKTVQEIFEEEKNTNSLFQNIIALESGSKYLYDISITLFVDYSLSKLPPESICKK